MEKLTELTLTQTREALVRGRVSARELTQAWLDAMEAKEGDIGAFITRCPDRALAEAEAVDDARVRGEELPPLAGIPMAVKDNICVQGLPTTCASKMLEDFTPPYDATAYEKLRWCPLLGKTNLDEFAMGSTTENSAFHVTRNPRDTSRVPGGSSGGSAACVAAGEAPFALGSDTGGSIRQPAAFCGVVGMKPTYGAVSRYGLVAFASSLDQIGPMTRTVADNALVLDALAGYDRRDSTSVKRGYIPMGRELNAGVKGLRIGLPKEFFGKGLAPAVKKQVLRAAKLLEKEGATVTEVSIPSLDYALPAYYVISSAEASSNLARFDGVRYGYQEQGCASLAEQTSLSRAHGFGEEAKRRQMLGAYLLSSGTYDKYYYPAQQVRTLITQDYARAYESCDVILMPASPRTAFKFGEMSDPTQMYASDMFTISNNIAGNGGVSVPLGLGEKSALPVSAQLQGPAFKDRSLLTFARAIERSFDAAGAVAPAFAGKEGEL